MAASPCPLLTILPDALWEELRALAPPEAERTDHQPAAPEDGGGEAAAAKRRELAEPLWAALAVGDVVLARDYDRDGESVGWWEAVVLAPADGDSFTLGWRDYPEQGLGAAPAQRARAAAPGRRRVQRGRCGKLGQVDGRVCRGGRAPPRSALTARSTAAQARELVLRVLAHNLMLLRLRT